MNGIARLSVSRCLTRLARWHHHSSGAQKQWLYEELTSRSFLKAQGKDSKDLLQGLTTNDIDCLDKNCAVIYSLILNVKGRVLYDALIYKLAGDEATDGPAYLIECDTSVAPDLLRHMKLYKLRKKVRLSDEAANYRLWALLPGLEPDVPSTDQCRPRLGEPAVCVAADPRVRCWSARLILPPGVSAGAVVEGSAEASPGSYAGVRYRLGIPEGVVDLPVAESLPLEANGALLNGISFNKGCYLGQELTARTYHTGVVRKRLMPVRVTQEDSWCAPNSFVLNEDGKQVGRLRGLVDGRGVALLRLSLLSSPRLTLRCADTGREASAETHVPAWWPEQINVKL